MELRVLSHIFSGIIQKSAGHSVDDSHLIRGHILRLFVEKKSPNLMCKISTKGPNR
jgi:hypothetical protein